MLILYIFYLQKNIETNKNAAKFWDSNSILIWISKTFHWKLFDIIT